MIKRINQYKKFLVPLVGILLIGLRYLEEIFRFWNQLSQQNSRPAGRPFKIGDPDSKGFKQVVVKPASGKESIPTGVTPEVHIEASGTGILKAKISTLDKERPTDEVLKDLNKYL